MITKIEYSHMCSRYRCFWSKTKKDKQKLSYNNKWYLLKRKWCIYDALKILSTGLTKQRPMYLTFFACVSTSSSISREEALRFFIQLGSTIIGAEGFVCLFACPLICNRHTSDFKTSLIWTTHFNKQQPNVNFKKKSNLTFFWYSVIFLIFWYTRILVILNS